MKMRPDAPRIIVKNVALQYLRPCMAVYLQRRMLSQTHELRVARVVIIGWDGGGLNDVT
jgi:hypothetical protein